MPDGEQKTEKGREEEVMSETTERAMEANMKILVGNEIAHSNRINSYAELSLKSAVEFQQKANDAYLERMEKMSDAYMAMNKQQNDAYMETSKKQSEETLKLTSKLSQDMIENNRYTLDRLYSVFPEEATGIGTLVAIVLEALRQKEAETAVNP